MNSDGPELTAVQYARLHGLSVNYLAEPLPTSHIETFREHIPEGLTEDTHLPNIDLPVHVNLQETLTLDKRATEFLHSANSGLTTLEELEDIIFPLLDTCQTKKLRLETPLLRTDHESDFRSFARWESSHFKDGCLPWEPLDDEMDVGLGWPRSLKGLPVKLLKELRSEKIEMQKDTLFYLQATIKSNWTSENDKKMWESATSYKRNTTLGLVTPPLLPLPSLSSPYIPPSPDCHLPLLSDPPSLISEDLWKAEQAIFEQDSLLNPAQHSSPFTNSPTTFASYIHVKPSDAFLPTELLVGEEQFPVSTRIKAEDRRVEVPLMPIIPIPNRPETLKFNDVIESMLLDSLSTADHSELSVLGSDEGCTFFREAYGDAAASASRKIEQEQLQQADANSRIQIPIMDFRLPDPPWKFIQSKDSSVSITEVQKAMVADIQEQYGRPRLWTGLNKLVPKLRWTCFPLELAKVGLDESFGDDEVLHKFLDNGLSQLVVDSGKLTWKSPGFRILKEDKDNDEDDLKLGYCETEEGQDIASLVRKRKMQYEEESSNFNSLTDTLATRISAGNTLTGVTFMEHQMCEEMIHGRKSRDKVSSSLPKDSTMTKQKLAQDRKDEINPLIDGTFSASNALDSFLEIRASKKQRPTHSAHFDGPSIEGQCSKSEPVNHSIQPTPSTQPHTVQQPLPVPSTNPSSIPTHYIVSSAILKRRVLIRTLNALFPAAIPIERDFTVHNRTAWMSNSVTRSPVTSSLDSEADFIISPSTGIILTTLQKIKQKPLPGQKAKSAFKERIEKVSVRYEKLVVLVSESCAEESTNGLDQSDTLALAEATGFCSSLDGSVRMQFVGGGEETLAKWLVAIMVRYGSQGESSVPLLEDETLWELFLRRAGMNAYAAQAVIAELKAPDGVDVEGESKACLFGMTAFVEMRQEERIARFERLLGGRQILQRVGRVLDANWS